MRRLLGSLAHASVREHSESEAATCGTSSAPPKLFSAVGAFSAFPAVLVGGILATLSNAQESKPDKVGQSALYPLAIMTDTSRRLESWKEIADFFSRDEKTVRRWEKNNALPVHRIPGGAKGRVFAYSAELSEWLNASKVSDRIAGSQESRLDEPHDPAKPIPELLRFPASRKQFTAWALVALLAVAILAYGLHHFRPASADPNRAPDHRPYDAEAEDLYLTGRYYWNQRTPDDLNRAVDYFTQAIVRDPNYSKPYVGLADCYNLLREFSAMPPGEAYPRAFAAATKAVELDRSSAEAYTSLAFVTFFWKWDAVSAEREFRQAIALKPDYARAHHWYASFLFSSGRFPEALAQIEEAQRLNPSSRAILADKGLFLYHTGQTDAALKLLRDVETTEPSFASAHRYLSEILFDRKDYPGFLSEWKKTALSTNDQSELAVENAAETGFSNGGYQGMLENTLRVQKSFNEQAMVSAYSLAVTCARLGDKNDALRYLKIAYDRRESPFVALKNESAFTFLHNDPQFRDLEAHLNLPSS
jgi:tetratricopeptide (TPR) repeat protein